MRASRERLVETVLGSRLSEFLDVRSGALPLLELPSFTWFLLAGSPSSPWRELPVVAFCTTEAK